ncbi:MAG TPA: RHS repeat-associated core domain-containing protein [Burkholderiaceae bacterium]
MIRSQWGRAGGRALAALLVLGAACVAVRAQSPSNPYSYSRASSFAYDPTSGLLTSETVEPSNPQSCVTTSYGYDNFGNKKSATIANCGAVTGRAGFTTRGSSSTFAAATQSVSAGGSAVSATVPAGAFADSGTNALGQTQHSTYDPRFGTVVTTTGPNGLTTTWAYDLLGRKTLETRADGTRTVTAYCYIASRVADTSSNSALCAGLTTATNEVPADAIMFVHSEPRDASTAGVKNGPFTRVYMDRAGRQIRTVTEAFDASTQVGGANRLVVQDVDYNPYGVPAVKTQPRFLDSGSSTSSGSGDVGMSLTVVDRLGRTVASYVADSQGSQPSITFGGRGTRTASVTSVAYSGLVVTTTNDHGQTKVEEKNVIGEIVRVTDALGAQLARQYDAFGNLVATRDALQNGVAVSYDIRGRKTALSDPDTGVTSYDYDALGELVWQQTANQLAAGTSTTLAYDKLGRVTQRVDPEYTSTWVFDACTMGVGKLCSSSTSTGLTRTYVYDNLGRQKDVRTDVSGGPSLATTTLYDNLNGRTSGIVYPTGVTVTYGYTAKGFVQSLQTATALVIAPRPTTPGGAARSAGTTLAANTALWSALSMNAWGRVEQHRDNVLTGGSAFTTTTGFDPQTGRVTAETAGLGSATSAMNLTYGWDSLDHLVQRADNNGAAWVDPQGHSQSGAVTDSLVYDRIGRLQVDTVAAPGIPNLMRTVEFEYNALGMLLYKSDVGVYSYPASGPGAVRPHAVQSVNGAYVASYSYDADGNAMAASAGAWRQVHYTSFNMPDGQSGIQGPSGGPQYTWLYDENHTRFKEIRTNASVTRTTWLLHPDNQGGLGFEREEQAAGNSNRHFLSVGGTTVGVIVTVDALPTLGSATTPPQLGSVNVVKLEFWHVDRQGSLMATSDHAGAITAIYAYDPFGKRRNRDGEYDASGALVFDWTTNTDNGTPRGYTGHEHLDDVGLIHMNGRLYDPVVSRFMQGDPFIADPGNLQDYDRYAYCMNTPTTCTDPSGYWHLFGHNILPGIFHNKDIMTVVAIAAAVCLGPESAVWGEWGVLGGLGVDSAVEEAAIAGFVSGAIATGSFKGAVEGAATGAAFSVAGDYINNAGAFSSGGALSDYSTDSAIGQGTFGAVAIHGVVGCVSASAFGGKCGPAALSAAFSEAASGYAAEASSSYGLVGGVTVSAIVGGTASVLGGGKFSNGAVTAAEGYLFNDCAPGHGGYCRYDLRAALEDSPIAKIWYAAFGAPVEQPDIPNTYVPLSLAATVAPGAGLTVQVGIAVTPGHDLALFGAYGFPRGFDFGAGLAAGYNEGPLSKFQGNSTVVNAGFGILEAGPGVSYTVTDGKYTGASGSLGFRGVPPVGPTFSVVPVMRTCTLSIIGKTPSGCGD